MAVMTTLQQLEEVQAAITEVMTSQSLTGPEGAIARASLNHLTERETMLLERYGQETGGASGQGGGLQRNFGLMRRD